MAAPGPGRGALDSGFHTSSSTTCTSVLGLPRWPLALSAGAPRPSWGWVRGQADKFVFSSPSAVHRSRWVFLGIRSTDGITGKSMLIKQPPRRLASGCGKAKVSFDCIFDAGVWSVARPPSARSRLGRAVLDDDKARSARAAAGPGRLREGAASASRANSGSVSRWFPTKRFASLTYLRSPPWRAAARTPLLRKGGLKAAPRRPRAAPRPAAARVLPGWRRLLGVRHGVVGRQLN